MHRSFKLAAVFLLVTGPAANRAQIHLKQDKPQVEDLQWLWQYTKPAPNGQKTALLADSRFTELLQDELKAPQTFWGNGIPLSEVAAAFLSGEGQVESRANRYLAITGCVIDQCAQRGLLWIDLGTPKPLIVFAAMRWLEQSHTPDEKEAPFSLWLFPDRNLDPQHVPQQLQNTLANWAQPRNCNTQQIRLAAVVDTDGTTHVTPANQLGVASIICTNSTGF